MQNNKSFFTLILVIIIIGAGYFLYTKRAQAPAQVACTLEAKICPDGSSVGRSGPQCEFAACPQATTTPQTPETLTLALNESKNVGGISIKLMKVLEDSRCPMDVECIQAGGVKVEVGINSNLETATFVLNGDPIMISPSVYLQLTQVTPNKISTKKIKDSDYKFSFVVQKDAQKINYKNATPDQLTEVSLAPGDTVEKDFIVTGISKGGWFFEGSFPVVVLDPNGKVLVGVPAVAQSEWTTTSPVSFVATIKIPKTYSGPAIIKFERDNPSGLPQGEASISFPIMIK